MLRFPIVVFLRVVVVLDSKPIANPVLPDKFIALPIHVAILPLYVSEAIRFVAEMEEAIVSILLHLACLFALDALKIVVALAKDR